jgi:hypothetical protein
MSDHRSGKRRRFANRKIRPVPAGEHLARRSNRGNAALFDRAGSPTAESGRMPDFHKNSIRTVNCCSCEDAPCWQDLDKPEFLL